MKKIIITTLGISAICVFFVCSAYIYLSPKEDANKRIDRIKNIVSVSSLSSEDISKLDSRQYEMIYKKYFKELYWSIKDKKLSTKKEYDTNNQELYIRDSSIGISQIEEIVPIYLFYKEASSYPEVIIPVYGKGLWSTMYGFLSIVGENLDTIGKIVFYQHGETPGLGDRITSMEWTSQFSGKKPFSDTNLAQPVFSVSKSKGSSKSSDQQLSHMVDGISGATLTSLGVENIINFWLSYGMIGNFLDRLRKGPDLIIEN